MGEIHESEVRIVAESLHPGDGVAVLLRRAAPHGDRIRMGHGVMMTIDAASRGRSRFSADIELSGKPVAVTMSFARRPDGSWSVSDAFGYMYLRRVSGMSRVRVVGAP